jgi:hypothetical protein
VDREHCAAGGTVAGDQDPLPQARLSAHQESAAVLVGLEEEGRAEKSSLP